LAASPWQSGGVSKSGNRRLRKTMIELAWFWLRHHIIPRLAFVAMRTPPMPYGLLKLADPTA
jgi:hypothetical protein